VIPPVFTLEALQGYYAAGGSPVAVAEAVIARIRTVNDAATWISRPDDAALLKAAESLTRIPTDRRGPLFGVPFAVKDNIDVAGVPTTAACPDAAYAPAESAPVVARLLEAGALFVGKTNLDQFATGLVGVRSPYGTPRNAFNADFIPGGSSSGSAVAVAAGTVAFSLGTDTAGSGRVPAMFNNLIGLKPTVGLIPTRGVVPACRSIDCVSIFALTVADAVAVLDVAAGYDPADPYSRAAPAMTPPAANAPRFAVPLPHQRDFLGDVDAAARYEALIARLGAVELIDIDPFLEIARLLYDGPWVAERTAALRGWVVDRPDSLHPTTRAILAAGLERKTVDAFDAFHKLAALRRATAPIWDRIDALILPTAPTIWRLDEVAAEPVARNSDLGRYTNFVNLMDLAALAIPNGFRGDGMPVGVTLVGPAWSDWRLARLAEGLLRQAPHPLGASGVIPIPKDCLPIVVIGAHMAGLPLNGQLTERGAVPLGPCQTSPDYRFYRLPGTPARPGLVRVARDGASITGEIWAVPMAEVGSFLDLIPPPLGLGSVTLSDGRVLKGFLCEAAAVAGADTGAKDITAHGGWRAAMAAGAL
jgi:allophanate hydrolase